MRKFVCAAVALVVGVAGLMADEKPVKDQIVPTMGTVKKVDAEKGTLTVSTKDGATKEFQVADETVFVLQVGAEQKEMKGKEGLKCESLKEGTMVVVQATAEGKVVRVMAGDFVNPHKAPAK